MCGGSKQMYTPTPLIWKHTVEKSQTQWRKVQSKSGCKVKMRVRRSEVTGGQERTNYRHLPSFTPPTQNPLYLCNHVPLPWHSSTLHFPTWPLNQPFKLWGQGPFPCWLGYLANLSPSLLPISWRNTSRSKICSPQPLNPNQLVWRLGSYGDDVDTWELHWES